MICPTGEAKYFCKGDWTTQISLRKHNKSPRMRNDIDGYASAPPIPSAARTGKSPHRDERTFRVSRTRRGASWRRTAEPRPNQGVNPLIQIGRPTSALERKTDESRTSRQVRKVRQQPTFIGSLRGAQVHFDFAHKQTI
jgi:hypothetical protein